MQGCAVRHPHIPGGQACGGNRRQRGDTCAGAGLGLVVVIVPGVAGVEDVVSAGLQVVECGVGLPVIIGGISICGIAILYRSLTTAYGIQRYTGCRTVGHRGRAGGGLATLSDGQRCGAGAAHQTGAGASRHAAEVGGDGIASNVETLSPDIVIQRQTRQYRRRCCPVVTLTDPSNVPSVPPR